MNHLITFMQSIQDIPAFCLNANGIIIATNQRAEEMEPGCIGLSIGDICPEYFGGNSSPDLSLYDSSRSFYAFDGKRLQLDRFGEYYLCRLLPESTVPFSDLTADPAALAEQAFTIRRSIRNLMDDFSMFEDLLDEFDILTEQMKEFYDVLEHGGATARKALLALNRIELSGDILAN